VSAPEDIAPSANSKWPGRGLVAWFAGNPVAANLLMLLFIVGGGLTAALMPTEVFPTLSPRSIQVSTFYPGATPGDVEESITRRVEEAVLGLDGVERVRSVASEGRGTVTVELADFADAQVVKDDVETAVESLTDFPSGKRRTAPDPHPAARHDGPVHRPDRPGFGADPARGGRTRRARASVPGRHFDRQPARRAPVRNFDLGR
jgi:hypothetical protein